MPIPTTINNTAELDSFMQNYLPGPDSPNLRDPAVNKTVADYCILGTYDKTGPNNCTTVVTDKDPIQTCMPLLAIEGPGSPGTSCQNWYSLLSQIGRDDEFNTAVDTYCKKTTPNDNVHSRECGCVNALRDPSSPYANKYATMAHNLQGKYTQPDNAYCWLKQCRAVTEGQITNQILVPPTSFAKTHSCIMPLCASVIVKEGGSMTGNDINQQIDCTGDPNQITKDKIIFKDGNCIAAATADNTPNTYDTMAECNAAHGIVPTPPSGNGLVFQPVTYPPVKATYVPNPIMNTLMIIGAIIIGLIIFAVVMKFIMKKSNTGGAQFIQESW